MFKPMLKIGKYVLRNAYKDKLISIQTNVFKGFS